jgi:hypothetical protein
MKKKKSKGGKNMEWLIGLGITSFVYLIIGVLLALFEMSQTDDPFNVSVVFTWIKMFW